VLCLIDHHRPFRPFEAVNGDEFHGVGDASIRPSGRAFGVPSRLEILTKARTGTP